jgi:pimeloyl-ACP methyl ester carboxylesterase
MLICASALLFFSASAPATPAGVVDTLLDVGSYRLHLVVHRGTRPLTIVMESGGGAALDSWSGVDAELARRTGATVVAYDRAGFGRSETGPADLTPWEQVRELDDALVRLGTPPARIVVGHSYGGVMAVLQAHLYPDHVRGLVLVDPMNARFVRATGEFVYSTVPHIEHPATRSDTAVARMVAGFDALIHDPRASDVGLHVPMVVLTAGDLWWGKPGIDSAWRAAHEALAAAAPDRRLVIVEGSKHQIPERRPEAIVSAVASLLPGRGN